MNDVICDNGGQIVFTVSIAGIRRYGRDDCALILTTGHEILDWNLGARETAELLCIDTTGWGEA